MPAGARESYPGTGAGAGAGQGVGGRHLSPQWGMGGPLRGLRSSVAQGPAHAPWGLRTSYQQVLVVPLLITAHLLCHS